MSWDILAMNIPAEAEVVSDIPSDYEPEPIGSRDETIARIMSAVPTADFSDPSWGIIDGGGFSIEVNMGNDDPLDCIMFHVRGVDAAVGVVAAILNALNLRAFDLQTGDFFQAGPEAIKSFQKWRAYRDRAIRDTEK